MARVAPFLPHHGGGPAEGRGGGSPPKRFNPNGIRSSVVLDSTILVSAFLKAVPGGASFDLLALAAEARYELFLSEAILEETARVLRTSRNIRRRYVYPDDAVDSYVQALRHLAKLVKPERSLRIVRDPDDDIILATAISARANSLVTRDKDLLVPSRSESVEIIPPELLLERLRSST